ncbi:glycosyltransferase [uncultured Tenacibaculum sp.]|uniref:glycosyltransferase n=1 Tax=uncultured Tenacibaculum sp. TaxID=174713 RepID=UPI0026354C98|nr:glycosyltransferase [uncultured Tenacibaculum sp.]
MRVLNLANVAGLKRGGGVHEVAFAYFKLQNFKEVDSHLWFPGSKNEEIEIREDLTNEMKIRIKALDTYLNPNYGLLKKMNFLKKELSDFDLIHQHGLWLRNSELSIAAARDNIPVIIQPHGYLEPFSLKMSSLKKKVMYNLFEKINLTRSSILIGCSEREVKHLRDLFPNKDIALIPNGVWRSFIKKEEKKKSLAEKRKMLFLSRIHPSKGIERLFLAFSKLNQTRQNSWELTIAGNGEAIYIESLKAYANELGIKDKVIFCGPVFNDNKIKLFDSSDLFVLPTYTENFGIVVAEALARSVPVLTTYGAPWENLHTTNSGFWVENTQEGIEDGLFEATSKSTAELEEMGVNGRELVLKDYVWEDIGHKTIQLYKWLLGEVSNIPNFVSLGNKKIKNKKMFKNF